MSVARETRFAVVLNGGVSLAVWMGGVTHELDRLRLASQGPEVRPPDEAEGAVHDAWSEILVRASRKAVVDTVAGTSAGGLNGTLLAAAVAGGRELPDMRRTWSELASLEPGRLLRAGGGPVGSLLDGEFLHERIEDLLGQIADRKPVADPADCTLLVTSTALDPDPVPIRLEGRARASVVDSRRVYRFHRRTDDRGLVTDDFAESRPWVALASRASASFPMAFGPVWESNALRGFRESSTAESRSSWLMDGGVLDNAPFEPLLRALRARAVGAPFDRVVLYVTPSPGTAGTSGTLGRNPTPTQVLGRVLSADREPDQRLDQQQLRESFERMGFSRAAPHEPVVRLMRSPDPFMETSDAMLAADQWFETYRLARTEAVERRLTALGSDVAFSAPQPTELVPEDLTSVPAQLPVGEEVWGWGLKTAERLFRWWGRALVEWSKDSTPLVTADAFNRVERSQRMVARLVEDLDAHMRRDLGRTPRARAQRLNAFYAAGADRELRRAVAATAEALVRLPLADGMDADTLINFTLAVEVVSSVLTRAEGSDEDMPRFRYRQVTPAAESIIDIGEVAGSPDWLDRKLYGQRWAHFGAFASEGGRRADWLWGRLDAASALSDYLLEGFDEAEAYALRTQLAMAILLAEGTSPDGLRDMAATACETEPEDLLLDMDPVARRDAARLLWANATGMVRDIGEGDARSVGPAQALRAFADPTWTRHDLPPGSTLRARFVARLIRWYGAPARWFVRRRIRKALEI
jgi:predicted acylesterase/phospholipase RssA